MSPVTHFFIGWLTANTARIDSRERMLITVAGIAPDADGLVVLNQGGQGLRRHSAQQIRHT